MWKSVLLACLVGLIGGHAMAQSQPLLMEGKKALYQRVLSKPGARILPAMGSGEAKPTTPFSAYYVYDRRRSDGADWLQLGLNRHGEIAGWMAETETMPWNQGLTVAFRDPLGADRVLLFRDKPSLKRFIDSRDKDAYRTLYRAAEAGELADDSPVIAIQPRTHIDILKDFYLVPIRDHEEVYLGSEQARILQVSSVPLAPPTPQSKTVAAADEAKPAKPFRSAVVFVIDSTLSMDPYIERTREAVRKIYDTITQEQLTGDVSFGLIAFRDNPRAASGLEYLTRTFVPLAQGQDAESFFKHVAELKAATVSSRDFIEDSYAGVNEAIAGIDWRGQDARYVVLITDAGPRQAGDPFSGTGLSSAALRRLAQNKGIALSVLHLLTPSEMADHPKAEATYRDLSYYPGIGSFYFGVETGNVERFGRVLDALAQQITDQVKLAAMAAAGKDLAETRQAEERQAATETPDDPDQLVQFQAKVAKLGYALRMRYLRQGEQGRIPDLFNAWLVDRDIGDPRRQTLDVRVLLTRDQLSDLHSILRQVLSTAEEGLLSPRSFLNDLKSLAATIARDPEQLGTTTRASGARTGNLADMGFMREYIEDLPYTGEVMNISLENWQDWPAKEQIDFINRLEEKINYYQVLHDHTDLWVSLDGGPIGGDSVFPIALEMLP
jgi:hypothetical protein